MPHQAKVPRHHGGVHVGQGPRVADDDACGRGAGGGGRGGRSPAGAEDGGGEDGGGEDGGDVPELGKRKGVPGPKLS